MGFVVLCRKYTEKLWIDLKWIQQSIGQVNRLTTVTSRMALENSDI
jgi:hypothetical protein